MFRTEIFFLMGILHHVLFRGKRLKVSFINAEVANSHTQSSLFAKDQGFLNLLKGSFE